jgi:hypothetical protein
MNNTTLIIISLSVIGLIIGGFYFHRNYEYVECSKYENYYYYLSGGGIAPGINTKGDFSVHSVPSSKIYVSKEEAQKAPNIETESKCVEGDYWIKKVKNNI